MKAIGSDAPGFCGSFARSSTIGELAGVLNAPPGELVLAVPKSAENQKRSGGGISKLSWKSSAVLGESNRECGQSCAKAVQRAACSVQSATTTVAMYVKRYLMRISNQGRAACCVGKRCAFGAFDRRAAAPRTLHAARSF